MRNQRIKLLGDIKPQGGIDDGLQTDQSGAKEKQRPNILFIHDNFAKQCGRKDSEQQKNAKINELE